MRMTHALVAAPVLLALAGCGQSVGNGQQSGGAKAKTVTIKGSDTMVILCGRWAEIYMHHNPGVKVQVTGGGTGVGVAALINGGTDICAASRPMKDKEKAQVKARHGKDAVAPGKEVCETPVALDGLSVIVNESNPAEQLSLDQLDGIYRGKIADWKEVGGAPGRIVCYGRENSSGTHLYFKEHVLKNQDFAANVQSLPGTAAIINAVSKDKSGIGYSGVGFVVPGVKEIKVSAKEGEKGILPTKENVVSGVYPISRKLYFYTVGEPAGEVKTFIEWTLGEEGQKVCEQVGYYPMPRR
ncbi:MAG: phosphate ABC transporter substrate-binding protein [Planctomycetota bacterium]|nr:phosphate ABC transporter substrate-binding protein [Planctomycetota bacterium]